MASKKQKTKKGSPLTGSSKYLTKNMALEVNSTVVQAPGLKVTEEEQNLANTGLLEYIFQVEFKLKNNVSELGMF